MYNCRRTTVPRTDERALLYREQMTMPRMQASGALSYPLIVVDMQSGNFWFVEMLAESPRVDQREQATGNREQEWRLTRLSKPSPATKGSGFRGIERPENGTVCRFQRDGAGRPVVGGPAARPGRKRSFPMRYRRFARFPPRERPLPSFPEQCKHFPGKPPTAGLPAPSR